MLRLILLLVLCFQGAAVDADSGPFQGVLADSQLMPDTPLRRFAFGSCNHDDDPQPFWPILKKLEPQAFVWLGDIVYHDIHTGFLSTRKPQPIPAMQKKYNLQKQNNAYRSFADTGVIITGVWDDHDYGINNGGSEYVDKVPSKALLMEFFEEPSNSPRMQREGVYASYTYGPKGKRVKMILLDGRYFLSEVPSPHSDMLGETQWKWLEHELRNNDAQITFIGSGVQVISDDKNILIDAESWGKHPSSRKRLLHLINSLNVSGLMFLSGDIHQGELCRLQCSPVKYPLYDITSSGLTHSWRDLVKWNFLFRLGHFVLPNENQILHPFEGPNAGIINIDWDSTPVQIHTEIITDDGSTVLKQTISLADLQPSEAHRLSCTDEDVRLSTISARERPYHWMWVIRFLGVFSLLTIIGVLPWFAFLWMLLHLYLRIRSKFVSDTKKRN